MTERSLLSGLRRGEQMEEIGRGRDKSRRRAAGGSGRRGRAGARARRCGRGGVRGGDGGGARMTGRAGGGAGRGGEGARGGEVAEDAVRERGDGSVRACVSESRPCQLSLGSGLCRVSAIWHSANPEFFKKTLKIFAESQADKALGKDYTLPSANPRTLGKGIFIKKTFLFPFRFP